MWNPQDYANNSTAQLKWAEELRSRLNLQGHESVLDIGCGDGKITANFAVHLPRGNVIGIDLSPEMISYAAETYPETVFPNLAFSCIDARHIPFKDDFDLIFSNAVLHWVDDHLAVLKGASEALKPRGRLVISCGGKGNAELILQTVFKVAHQEHWQQYFTPLSNPYFFYGTEEYQGWLADAGLRIERLELVPKDMVHADKTGLAGWLRTTWMPFTDKVPAADREKFITELVDTYIDHFPPDTKGLVHVPMVRLEVVAQKPCFL